MVFKQILEPSGEWINQTGERVTLLSGHIAYTPEGVNVGWTEFNTLEDCAMAWGLTYQPIEQLPYE